MTTSQRTPARTRTYANIASTVALVVALGGTGAHAAGLAKDSVRSKHIKNGQVRTVDLRDSAVTGAKVAPDSITGADIDESTLDLPPATGGPDPDPVTLPPSASVHRSARASGTVSTGGAQVVVRLEVALPEPGYVDVTAGAFLNGAEGSQVVDAYVLGTGGEVARGFWHAGDADGITDISQTMSGVAKVAAGTHVFRLFMADSGGTGSGYSDAHVIVRYFPEGSIA